MESAIIELMNKQDSIVSRFRGCRVAVRHRARVIEFVVDLCVSLKAQMVTCHLAVDVLDFYFSIEHIRDKDLELTAITCLWIALKYEEVHLSQLLASRMLKLLDNVYSVKELVDRERLILRSIDFRLHRPTTLLFLNSYIEMISLTFPTLINPKARTQMCCMADLVVLDIRSTRFSYRVVALAILYLHCSAKQYLCKLGGLSWEELDVCVEYITPFYNYILSDAGQSTLPEPLVDTIQQYLPDIDKLVEAGIISFE